MITKLDFLSFMKVMSSAALGAGLDFIPLVDKSYQHFKRQGLYMKASIFIARSTVGSQKFCLFWAYTDYSEHFHAGLERVWTLRKPPDRRQHHMNLGYSLTNNQQVWETDTVNAQWATHFEKCLLSTPGGPGLGDNFFLSPLVNIQLPGYASPAPQLTPEKIMELGNMAALLTIEGIP